MMVKPFALDDIVPLIIYPHLFNTNVHYHKVGVLASISLDSKLRHRILHYQYNVNLTLQ